MTAGLPVCTIWALMRRICSIMYAPSAKLPESEWAFKGHGYETLRLRIELLESATFSQQAQTLCHSIVVNLCVENISGNLAHQHNTPHLRMHFEKHVSFMPNKASRQVRNWKRSQMVGTVSTPQNRACGASKLPVAASATSQ